MNMSVSHVIFCDCGDVKRSIVCIHRELRKCDSCVRKHDTRVIAKATCPTDRTQTVRSSNLRNSRNKNVRSAQIYGFIPPWLRTAGTPNYRLKTRVQPSAQIINTRVQNLYQVGAGECRGDGSTEQYDSTTPCSSSGRTVQDSSTQRCCAGLE